jgi:hypothetical protein
MLSTKYYLASIFIKYVGMHARMGIQKYYVVFMYNVETL